MPLPDTSLPQPVRAYLERALPSPASVPVAMRIEQVGEMWLKQGARPRRFTATQEYAVSDVAFTWRARFPIALGLALRVVDRYAAGEGSLEARLLGVPVMRQRGPETSLGEALRYLAELPWAPYAMAANPHLGWRQLADGNVEVATNVGAKRAVVTIEFDSGGDVSGCRCGSRPYPQRGTFVDLPWSGSFSDYAVLGGVRLPTRAQVRWELPAGPFTYWRGTFTAVRL
jgi:hypothetical protein